MRHTQGARRSSHTQPSLAWDLTRARRGAIARLGLKNTIYRKIKMDNTQPIKFRVLRYIIEYRKKNKFSPSLREIAAGLGFKNLDNMISSMKYAIGQLVELGYLTAVPGISRSYIPTKEGIDKEKTL